MPRTLGQTLVIDNRGGAGGNIGADIAAKSPPDGYTLLVSAEGPITIALGLYPKLPYNPLRDLAPITQLINYANVLRDVVESHQERRRKGGIAMSYAGGCAQTSS